jgi:hypothetical protein
MLIRPVFHPVEGLLAGVKLAQGGLSGGVQVIGLQRLLALANGQLTDRVIQVLQLF